MIQPQGIFDGSIRRDVPAISVFDGQFRNQQKVDSVGILIEQGVEGIADGGFFFGAAEMNDFLQFTVVVTDGVDRHRL